MATVPRYNSPQVQATNLPNVRISDAGATPEAFGAGIGRGLAQLGQAVHQIAELEREKQDTASKLEIENQLAELENVTIHDPDHGVLSKRGKAAMDAGRDFNAQWRKQQMSIVDAAPQRLRQWATQQAEARRIRADRIVMNHSVDQSTAFYTAQSTTLQANAQNSAVLNYLDPDRVDEEIARGLIAVDRQADLVGADDATRQQARAVFVSTSQRQVIERMLVADPLGAQQRLGQVRNRLTGKDQVELDQQLHVLEADEQGDADAAWALAGGGMPASYFDRKTDGVPAPKVPAPIQRVILAAADRYGVPRHVALALAQQESGFNPKAVGPETKYGRARGLFQYLDSTAQALGIDPEDPVQAADAAMRQLSEQAKAKGWEWAVKHHFAGPDTKLHGPKTATYVRQVQEKARRFAAAAGVGEGQGETVVAQGAATLEQALTRVQSIPDPARRKLAEGKLRDTFALLEARRQAADQAQADAIYAKIANADPAQPLRAVLSPQELVLVGRDSALSEAINRYRKLTATGQVIEDDAELVDYLARVQAWEPDKFKNMSLVQYAGRLSGKTLLALTKDQREAHKPEKRERWIAEDTQLALAYDDMGLRGEGSATLRGQFRRAFYTEKRGFMDRNSGREPNADETQQILNRLKLPFVKEGFLGFGGGTRRAYEGQASGYQVPSDARTQILAAFKRAGIANPAEGDIVNAYLRSAGGSL